jgi:hypothetical protein
MNTKITNPFLKQIISEISNKTVEGRITNLSWSVIEEGKKKKKRLTIEADKKEGDSLPPLGGEDEPTKETPPAPENPPAKDAQVAGLGDVNPAEQGDKPEAGDAAPEAEAGADAAAGPEAGAEGDSEDPEKAKADAVKAKAELEKAKAEKEEAEQELEQQSVIKLTSKPGVSFLLGKLLGDAVEKNTVDALAGEMADKLKIETPEDFEIFSNQMTPFKAMPGVAQLLNSIKTASSSQPKTKETKK